MEDVEGEVWLQAFDVLATCRGFPAWGHVQQGPGRWGLPQGHSGRREWTARTEKFVHKLGNDATGALVVVGWLGGCRF